MTHEAYIRKETMVSMVINGVLSAVFFLLVFGMATSVPAWGVGNWVFDFLPQSFMITLMSTLVPGALTAKRLKAGEIQPGSYNSRLPRSLVMRALLLAVLAAAIGTGLVAAIITLTGVNELALLPAFGVKVIYGIALGAIVTPIGLRAALSVAPGSR
jgi:hypothetical protein